MNSDRPKSLGRYEIVRELGKGAMGVVYEGRDPVIGRRVAIKTARRDVLESSGMADELMERFLREARSAGNVNHPNVITIYDAGEENGVAWMAMEFIESGTLFDRLCDGARMTPEEAVKIGAAICEALAAAHDKGVVHRDVKPANIMLLHDGAVKVADFGIARVTDSKLTQEGVLVGTPQYMSPEQFMGLKVDGRSDLFSAAVIIYEMLTGEHPFPAHGVSAIMHQVIKVDPVAPREINVAVNDNLSAVVMKCLQKGPNRRYQNGRLMAAALLEALKENPDPAVLALAPPAHAAPDAATVVSGARAETALQPAPPGAQPAESTPSVAGAKPPAGARRFSRRAIMLTAIAGVAVTAGAGLILSALRTGGAPEAGFENVTVCVFRAKSLADYAKALEHGPSSETCETGGAASIMVTDASTNVVIDVIAEDVSESLPIASPFVTITVVRDGYEISSERFDAAPGEKSLVRNVILKPST